MSPPSSVYRLQLGPGFGFAEAARRAPYLHALGVDALYLSPVTQAAPGSPHGYDVVDPCRLNAELGGEEGFNALCAECARLGLKIVLDWVPNHMGTAESNALWTDVLENGCASPYARFFDIEWEPAKPELQGKVLLPLLPDLYGRVLEDGGVSVTYRDGALRVVVPGRSLPVAPETYPLVLERGLDALELPAGHPDREELLSLVTSFRNLPGAEWERAEERAREKEIGKRRLRELIQRSDPVRLHVERAVASINGKPGDNASFDGLDGLLARQHYRLAHWKVAAQEINYRRFFNINELAALRMEEEAVFKHCHALVLRLVAERKVHGLRIDHIDGLYAPAEYLARLKATCAEPVYLVVEKILDRREALPEAWPVDGTVGYEFLNALGGLFVDQAKEKEVDAAYEAFTGHRVDFDLLVYSTKKLFAAEYMASEVHALGHRLDRLSESSRHYRDFTRYQLTFAMREIVDSFPVYRTYISAEDTAVSERDAQYIKIAVEKARRRTPAIDAALYDFLQDLLLLRLEPPRVQPKAIAMYRDIVLRFQQFTGPIMAKGLEDTAFYSNSRLLCLNEVGGDPAHFGVSPQDFHQQNAHRAAKWPAGLLATSTHDTKRSEDARHRLAALSELAAGWRAAVSRWSVINAKHKTEVAGAAQPSGDTEYMIYQTLLAAWPDEPNRPEARAALLERAWEHSLKAAREAKRETNWVRPDAAYEAAVRRFLEGLLEPSPENRFIPDFEAFAARAIDLGRLNSLSALTLKLASPGVVDTYQGCELWNHRLVDPDNRRPVDFDLAERLLGEAQALPPEQAAARLFAERADGRIKQLLLHRGLLLRSREPALFIGADYLPLRVDGPRARNAVAFARKTESLVAIAAAGRFFADLADGGAPEPSAWGDTLILLPASMKGWGLRDAYTGRIVAARPHDEGAALALSELFETLPCALLTATR